MGKRDAFLESIWAEDGETVAWPSEPSERRQLASNIVGAAVIGAAEHVVGGSLDRLVGKRPEPGSNDYQAKNRDVQVLSTLTDEQRNAVTRLVRETAYFALYWPMAKIGQLPGIVVDLVATRVDKDGGAEGGEGEDGASEETFDLTDFLSPHQLLIEWVAVFGEYLDPDGPLEGRWKDVLLRPIEPAAPTERGPFTGELVAGQVVFSGPSMVVVRVGGRNVTVHMHADVVRGEEVRVGLSQDGQPRVLEVRGTRFDVP